MRKHYNSTAEVNGIMEKYMYDKHGSIAKRSAKEMIKTLVICALVGILILASLAAFFVLTPLVVIGWIILSLFGLFVSTGIGLIVMFVIVPGAKEWLKERR